MSTTGVVWGLDTGRQGEFMQVSALGQAIGLGFERIRLSPEGTPPATLPAAPPRLILSFGRAARAALHLAEACTAGGSAPRPLLVHLGTPGQIPITAFDLIIPMPQDDYPEAPNVHFLRLPLNGATTGVSALPSRGAPAQGAGQCTVIVGGPSRHFRLNPRTTRRLVGFGARLAAANGESLHIVTSPRTPASVLIELRRLRAGASFTLHEFGEIPFAGILQAGSRFVVTADSASMLAEACRTGAPVWLFPLPPRPNVSDFLQHAADRCLGAAFRHRLVRHGQVGGGTNFRRWHSTLERLGYILTVRPMPEQALRWAPRGAMPDNDLADCRTRILALMANTA